MSSNTPDRTFSTTLSREHRGQRGIAIITVLSVLLLMTVLIVSFFKMAQSELVDAKNYSENVRTRQLTEIVTNFVTAQIREATRTNLGGSARYTWASQPGAITQFTSEVTGNTDFRDMGFRVYKLYSSSRMQAGTNTNDNLARDVPGDWDESPARFVDLNEPVYNATQDKLFFPIIDPRGYNQKARASSRSKTNLEGFTYSDTNSRNSQINGVIEPGNGGIDSQRLPMPVEWLYMLADGTIGSLTEDGNTFLPPSGGSTPTKRNPIVARVAFWTDDESAKININVASEGAFWDLPRADTQQERNFGRYQPARNETYRYPGHVTGISLSPVLYPGIGSQSPGADPYLSEFHYQNIMEIAPKVAYYEAGSGIGKTEASPDTGSFNAATKLYTPDTGRLYATIDEMLFSDSVGTNSKRRKLNRAFENEQVLRNFERASHSLTVHSNAPEITLFGTPRICLWAMKDVGLYQPNIPINAQQTYFDRLISFAATVGTRRYYWQRNTPGSRHGELYNSARSENMNLLTQYMIPLMENPIPAYGGSFRRKYFDQQLDEFGDSREIMVQIWDYMRNTNLNDPLLSPGAHYNEISHRRVGPKDLKLNQIGRGQIAGCCLCGGTQPHRSRWWKSFTPFPKGHGRNYTVSEVTKVFHARAENSSSGATKGNQELARALNQGEKLIEVGLLIETFCVTHGFTSIHPKSRIVVAGGVNTGSENGELYLGARDYPDYALTDEVDEATGELIWKPFGPLYSSSRSHLRDQDDRSGGNRPSVVARWDHHKNYVGKRTWGAHGGPRLFSAEVTMIETTDAAKDHDMFNPPERPPVAGNPNAETNQLVETDTLAWRVRWSKGGGAAQAVIDPLSNPLIVRSDSPTIFYKGSKQPLALVLYDQAANRQGNVNNLIQVFYVRFGKFGDEDAAIEIPAPQVPEDVPADWHNRIAASGKNVNMLISEESDVTRSMVVAHGDFRLISGRRAVNEHIWVPHPDFTSKTKRHAHCLVAADGRKLPGFSASRGYALDKIGNPVDYPDRYKPDFAIDPRTDEERFFPKETQRAKRYKLSVDPGVTGDFDQGLGGHIDGSYVNRPDDGTRAGLSGSNSEYDAGVPYFDNTDRPSEPHRTFFSPNRVIGEPGQLGSIPTGIQAEIPWRTLLFRPDVEHYGARNYPRVGDPPEHVLMDFFWMPVVEPFPISQPFATMGKVNMNYRIVPFDYIKRKTAMHAVLKDQRMLAIENSEADKYKEETGGATGYRFPIDIETTLLQFEDRFDKGEVFRSATEICEIYMVPRKAGAPKDRNTMGSPRRAEKGSKGWDYPPMRTFWKSHSLTADNSKERTYANIYPRLTTKSNVFKVHMIVEAIQKVRSVEVDVFDPERDRITGRWRGSAVIERNIDPAAIRPVPGSSRPTVPDYFQDPRLSALPSMEEYYAYRVLRVKQFNP